MAQVADVIGGREAPLSAEQKEEGEKNVPGEFSKVKHVRGILSMGRYTSLLYTLQLAQCVQIFLQASKCLSRFVNLKSKSKSNSKYIHLQY